MLYRLLLSTRPHQWIKNLFVLPALVFSGHVLESEYALRALAGMGCFCLLSGAVYLCNDVFDLPQDRLHPEKSRRPIAAGQVPVPAAMVAALLLFALGLAGAFSLRPHFGGVALAYTFLNLAYSWKLKHLVLIDVLIVASGFLLRALSGALVIAVQISTWFILCTFTLALFLAVVKRRQELVVLAQGAAQHRATLEEYSLPFLDQVIAVLTSSTLVCYALYATGVGESQTGGHMQWTIPFVLYGILRYLYVVYKLGGGANPTAVVWKDRPLQIALVLWGLASAASIYGFP
ncbi:MAG: decaprenyl-phosphate phosphoribosyltransferase [Candidatus Latescibacteria bacterium]|nr:decaprenyl-phosphate phosphoribosyltransferase [Candidatus Latescibacterota bacterium]